MKSTTLPLIFMLCSISCSSWTLSMVLADHTPIFPVITSSPSSTVTSSIVMLKLPARDFIRIGRVLRFWRSAVPIADAEAPGWVLPRDVMIRADHAAGPALDTVAPKDRGAAVVLDPVVLDRACNGAWFRRALEAHGLLDDLEMRVGFVDLNRERRELVVAAAQLGRRQVFSGIDSHLRFLASVPPVGTLVYMRFHFEPHMI